MSIVIRATTLDEARVAARRHTLQGRKITRIIPYGAGYAFVAFARQPSTTGGRA